MATASRSTSVTCSAGVDSAQSLGLKASSFSSPALLGGGSPHSATPDVFKAEVYQTLPAEAPLRKGGTGSGRFLWVQVKGGEPVEYPTEDLRNVGGLLKAVFIEEEARLKPRGVTVSLLRLYASEEAYKKNEVEQEVQRMVDRFSDEEYWTRPTPHPINYTREEKLCWPGTELPCPGALPEPFEQDDGRTTAYGIGNAYGTGKTEIAIHSAEETCKQEAHVRVAYISFSNGYKSQTLSGTVADTSVYVMDRQKLCYSKYCGLWLFAGIKATRVVDGEVQGNPDLFNSIVRKWVESGWELPQSRAWTDPNLIVIFDEVQAFTFDTLESLVTMELTPPRTRMTLLVGAFAPTFVFPSAYRVRDLRLPILPDTELAAIFRDRIPGAQMDADGVHLPGLFGGCVRPLACWSTASKDLQRNQDPVQACLLQYRCLGTKYRTPGELFRAVIASMPIKEDRLRAAFKQDRLALGAAFLSPEPDDRFLVALPPLHIAAGHFDFADEVDKGTQDRIRPVLANFCSPNWAQFEALIGIAPALRIASLACTGMQYELQQSVLQLVFGGVCNPQAQELLAKAVREDLSLSFVSGGTDVRSVNFSGLYKEDHCVAISMERDHDSEFDHFLMVPLDQGGKLVVCLDSKFSEGGAEAYLDFSKGIKPKLNGFERPQALFPEGWLRLVAIASNRRIADGTMDMVRNSATMPLVAVGQAGLGNLLSPSLVPPKHRSRDQGR